MKPSYNLLTAPIFLSLALLSLFSLLSAQAAYGQTSPTSALGGSTLTFGSQIVLDGCWSEAELKGAPAEKKTVSRRPSPIGPLPSCKNSLPPLPPNLHNSIRSVTPADGRKLIALTFDLCEGQGEFAGYDAEIVDFLRAGKIKATFFAGGKWLKSHPQRAMQLMADPLFEVGNHSWNHPNFRLISEAAIQEQILRTQAQYEIIRADLAQKAQAQGLDSSEMSKIPQVPYIFRFPYGTCNEPALRLTAALGLPAIQWNIVTADSCKTQTAEKIAQTIVKGAKSGAIVIMHANGKGHHTAKALAVCIPQLQQKGYEFATVSELLQAGPVVSTPTCYEMKPYDNLRYDRIPKKPPGRK